MPAASRKSDLFLLENHSQHEDIIDERQHLITGEKFVAKDGYHAALYRFSPAAQSPQKLGLKFDAPNGVPPVNPSGAWTLATDDYMIFGEESFHGPATFQPTWRSPNDPPPPPPGVWILSMARLQNSH